MAPSTHCVALQATPVHPYLVFVGTERANDFDDTMHRVCNVAISGLRRSVSGETNIVSQGTVVGAGERSEMDRPGFN